MIFKKRNWILLAVLAVVGLGFLFGADSVMAQALDTGLGEFDPGLGQQDIRVIIGNIIRIFLGFLGVIAVIIIIYGGFLWMFAFGREENLKKAQRTIVNGAIGLVIILSAYAIAHFTINAILDATGAGDTSSSSYSDGPGGPSGTPFGSGFNLESVVPSGAVPIRNVVVQVGFSSNVDSSTVNNNIAVRQVGAETPVAGVFSTSGPVVTFTPSEACPSPFEAWSCFDADTAYEVEVASGLKGTNGSFVSCGFSGCINTFVTGDIIDTAPPVVTITYPDDGAHVSVSPDVAVTMNVTDDAAIGTIIGYADDEVFGLDAPESVVTDYVSVINWVATGLVPGSEHDLDASVTDMAGNTGNASSITVTAVPDHCFDGEQNFGETGVDCGGDPDSADYCGACTGEACESDEDCSSGDCVDGFCVELPVIVSVTPDNGAPGNYITITGENFGNSAGEVVFLGDVEMEEDDRVAGLACTGSWTNTQVVVAVPSLDGLPEHIGPIELTTSSGTSDRSDIGGGPPLTDFEINTIERPGLCAISPEDGEVGDTVSITGDNLGAGFDSFLYFGAALASTVSDWSNSGMNAIVPAVAIGEADVVAEVGDQISNPISFEVVEPDLGALPVISYITPESGPVGEYITIFGSGFGSTEGIVWFTDPATGNTATGSTDFPDTCSLTDYWSNTSITVKVPQFTEVPDGEPVAVTAQNVHIEKNSGVDGEAVGFEIEPGTAGPGICGVSPVSGPTGLQVDIYGEEFGASPGNVTFYSGASTAASEWADGHIKVDVPENAATGPLFVTVSGNDSNEVNFEVGACSVENDTCASGTRCCANTLACTPLATECEAPIPDTNYLFEFVTGPVPVVPRVVVNCDSSNPLDVVMSPSPWSGRVGGDAVCTNAKISVVFTVDVTNIGPDTVLINECVGESETDPCEDLGDEVAGGFTVLSDRFEFDPTDLLAANTSYQVTLTTGIVADSDGGESLVDEYAFEFTTRVQPEACDLLGLVVTPGTTTLTEEGDGDHLDEDDGDVLLSASGIGNDGCVLLDPPTDGMSWSTSNNVGFPSSPSINLLSTSSASKKVAQAVNETVSGAVSAIATYIDQGISGLALVEVDYTDPFVQNYWPNCETACMNAEVGMQFNVAMDPATITDSSVQLERCNTELCAEGLIGVSISLPDMTDSNKKQVVQVDEPLIESTFYRVSIDSSVLSANGVALTDLNYGDTFSWTFRTSPTGAICSIDHVETTPSSVVLRAIGERQEYTVTPFGPPDDCSEGGQRVDSSDYDWAWSSSNTTTAFLLDGGNVDTGFTAGCNGSCLLSGSQSGVAICGNGGPPEYGEECDDGNTEPGDGCSPACLWEGTDSCTDDVTTLCCGNGVQDPYESCDDGNLDSGDGCSPTCQNEGSSSVGSVCGNYAIAYLPNVGGEECDDGNASSGDGCSSQCLWEGSDSDAIAVCGNGTKEVAGGEECDDGNSIDGDGCSSTCLFDGGVSCDDVAGGPCCGNGIREEGNFEQCDGDDEGCSDSCLLLGSSFTYSTPSFCGDGSVGPGEWMGCEGTGDGLVDNVQYAEVSANIASQDLPSNGMYSTLINALEPITTEEDDALLNVSCSCEASFECPTGGTNFACGEASGCCAPRPETVIQYPLGKNECRNVEVRAVFDSLMDESSFTSDEVVLGDTVIPGTPNIALRVDGVASAADCDAASGTYIASTTVHVPFVPQFINNWLSRAAEAFGAEPAHAIAPGCYFPTTPVAYTVGDHTEVVLRYSAALEANTSYSIVVVGDTDISDDTEDGLLTVTGAGFNAAEIALFEQFTTGNEICDLDFVSVEDTTGSPLFLTANTEHLFEATALSRVDGDNVPIVPISGVYDWDVLWSIPDDSDILALSDDEMGVEEGVTSGQVSGLEDVTAIAEITTDTLFVTADDPDGTVGRQVTGSLEARVFICEIPWPDQDANDAVFDAPLSDVIGNDDLLAEQSMWTNFSTLYCRAEVAPDDVAFLGVPVAHAQDVVLPDFIVTQPPVAPPGIEKEFILRHPTEPEAIGIRVMDNPEYLPVGMWFNEQGFVGSQNATEVNGFRAIQDGRTVYVGAVNINDLGDIQPMIYSIAYSEGASPETIDVYNQIVNNFTFLASDTKPWEVTNAQVCVDGANALADSNNNVYTCTSDIECIQKTQNIDATCDATKDKIRRDLARIEDARYMEAVVGEYGVTHKHCSVTTNLVCVSDSNCPGEETCEAGVPLLDAGTFIRGWSTSAWPSWTTELANELGTALPVDPLNQFSTCSPKYCTDDATQLCLADSDCVAGSCNSPGVCSGSGASCLQDTDCSAGESCTVLGYDGDTCWDGDQNLFQCPAGSHVYRYQRSGLEDFTLATDLETTINDIRWAGSPSTLVDNVSLVFGNMATFANPTPVPLVCDGSNYGASEVCGDGVVGDNEVCETGDIIPAYCVGVDADGNTYEGVMNVACSDTCSSYEDGIDEDGNLESECVPLSCGNGVVEGRCVGGIFPGTPCLVDEACGFGECSFELSDGAEECDDGAFNGLYGYCSTSCDTTTDVLACGNGETEGPEVCDDGSLNGVYNADGDYCAWDCSGPGPRCGDGIRNGGEYCDTEIETWSGALCSITLETCQTDTDCPGFAAGETCGGSVSTNACEVTGFCEGGDNDGELCTDADCSLGGGVCINYDTFRSRTCQTPDDVQMCWWNNWSECQQQGSCGNGILEAGEVCDDGNSNNNDACTNVCQLNVCGDGFINPATESCDLGAESNGDLCEPGYGGVCSYCTESCTYQTVSGAYCGDLEVQPEGGEVCDGAGPLYYVTPEGGLDGLCDAIGLEKPDTDPPAVCSQIGACNGSVDNGGLCVVDGQSGLNCASGITCEPALCNPGCDNSCPFNYQSIFVLATEYHSETAEPIPGADPTDSVELFSYQTNGTCQGASMHTDFVDAVCQVDAHCNYEDANTGTCVFENYPDYARVEFPDCRVGDRLLADVSYDIDYPELDVVFVIDQSSSMTREYLPTDQTTTTRWDIMIDSLEEAVDVLFDQYPAPLRVGVVTFGGRSLQDAAPGYDFEYSSTDCNNEPFWNGSDYDWPENWEDIQSQALSNVSTHLDTAACIYSVPTDDENDILNTISMGIPAPPTAAGQGYSTPTAAGLARAHEILEQYPADHKKIVVLLSDGKPTCNGHSSSWSEDCEPVVEAVYEQASLLKNEAIDLYSAYFNDDLTGDTALRLSRAFQVYSSDCPAYDGTGSLLTPGNLDVSTEAPYSWSGTRGIRWYGRYDACTETPAFSYTGDDVGAFEDMFEAIIDNIINARIYVGNNEGDISSTLLNQGPSIQVSLPTDFVCPLNGGDPLADSSVDIKLQFAGDGTVTLSNFKFQYCAE